MSSTSLFLLSITLLAFIRTVDSVHKLYSYDDGNGGDEHCCIARIDKNYCLATPITRSLIQVNKQCHQFDGHQHRRMNDTQKNDAYEDKIVRRLDIQSSEEVGDRLLFRLQTSLETDLLRRDLACLSSKKPAISFDKCYLQLADDLDNSINSSDEQDKSSKRHKRHRQSKNKKRVDDDSSKVDEVHKEVNHEEKIAEKEIRRSELHQVVHIREGEGLSIVQNYAVNVTSLRQNLDEDDRCLSWYRKQMRKMRHNPKFTKLCRKVNDHIEHCLSKLLFRDTEIEHHSHNTIVSLAIGSKLYCEDQAGTYKFLGVHRQGSVCLHANHALTIEQKFSDIAGLSNVDKNEDILAFIKGNPKYQAELEHDCYDGKTLVEIESHDKENQVKKHAPKSK
ncbi:unnamed protein product [Adineta ricciae]|uniref:Uncharacterized protein n=1 Tax=Adineta ricciae TaxID=249248 RepID=A0A814QNL4_ADIRI|nr:unnamed protein product [Adineta ricciae]